MPTVTATDFRLRNATRADLEIVLPWLGSRAQLQFWGLPGSGFPPQVDRVWAAIGGEADGTRVLADTPGRLAGFGQALPEGEDRVHLNRIVVAPGLRGRGFGRRLCLDLMDWAETRYRRHSFTLKVFQENLGAVALFRSLGFQECPGAGSANLICMGWQRPDGSNRLPLTWLRGA